MRSNLFKRFLFLLFSRKFCGDSQRFGPMLEINAFVLRSFAENCKNILNVRRVKFPKLPAKEAIKPEIFFSWALEFKAFQALTNIAGLPRRARVEVAGVGAVAGTPMVSVVTPPETYSDLLEAYIAETSLNQSLLSENSRLKTEIRSLKNEVTLLKRQRKTLSDKLSSAGKKGGRGNES